MLRERQRRKHLDVGYADPKGQGTHELMLSLVDATEELLAPFTSLLSATLADAPSTTLCLCADRALCDLPLEALAALEGSVTARDYSVGFHLARLKGGDAGDTIDRGSLRYICDPRAEDVEGPSGSVQRDAGLPVLSTALRDDVGGVPGGRGLPLPGGAPAYPPVCQPAALLRHIRLPRGRRAPPRRPPLPPPPPVRHPAGQGRQRGLLPRPVQARHQHRLRHALAARPLRDVRAAFRPGGPMRRI